MEITQVRVFPVDEDKLKAFASIIFDDCFVVSDIKIIQGNHGMFISMPSKKRRNGTFRDIAHPLNNETRQKIEDRILARYRELIDGEFTEDDLPMSTKVASEPEMKITLTESTRDILGP